MTDAIAPGIYFGMAEDAYHAAPALSASGIKNLLISPLDYWVNSHLNPDYEDRKTDAMIAGTAFHRRLLEPARFSAMYAAIPRREDYPDAVDGVEGLRALCETLGLKKAGRIDEMCERILAAAPDAVLWPVIRTRLLRETDGRILLKPDVLADIERAAAIVFSHPAAKLAMTGGFSEVSIFWTDAQTGVPMKMRADYLKTKAIVDVKTFSNSLGKPLNVAIASAVANERHHVQAVTYDAGVAAAKRMMFETKGKCVRVLSGPEPSVEWLGAFAACEDHGFVFVFIEQGSVTNVRVREFCRFDSPMMQLRDAAMPSPNAYWTQGEIGFRTGVKLYAECMKKYGPEKPWIDDEPMVRFADTDFPLYMLG